MGDKPSPSLGSHPSLDSGTAPGTFTALLMVALATAMAVASAFALLPSSPWTRVSQFDGTIYSNLIWVRQRAFIDKTPIDVAIIGDSRVKMGVSGPDLQTTLTRQMGKPIHVVNFGTLEEGRDLHYLVARDVIRTHPELQVLVLSLAEIPARRSHPAFPFMADPADLLRAPFWSYYYFPNLLKLPFRQLTLFASERMGTVAPLPAYRGSNPDTAKGQDPSENPNFDRIVPVAELLDQMHKHHSAHSVLLSEHLRKYEFAPEYTYLDRILTLARSRNIKIILIFQPCFGNYKIPIYMRYYSEYGTVVQISNFSNNPRFYLDLCHSNSTGNQFMTKRVAAAVADGLRSTGH